MNPTPKPTKAKPDQTFSSSPSGGEDSFFPVALRAPLTLCARYARLHAPRIRTWTVLLNVLGNVAALSLQSPLHIYYGVTMSEATITVSQPKVINICTRLAKAQACSATELKGHANALENLAKEFEIQYTLAVEARDEESIKVLQGQVAKDQGQIYESYYKLFRQAVGMGEPTPEPKVEALNPLAHSEKSVLQDQIWELHGKINAIWELQERNGILEEKVKALEQRLQFIFDNFTMKRKPKDKVKPV
jgi:hypothetical protein